MQRLGRFLGIALVVAAQTVAASSRPLVIYGRDDRREVYETGDVAHLILADSIAAVMSHENVDTSPTSVYAKLSGINYGEENRLCKTERFVEQDAVAYCTAFLVRDNVVATAGHCVSEPGFCTDALFVFGFAKDKPNRNPNQVLKKDVYSCRRVLTEKFAEDGADYALIELDRKVADRAPLAFAKETPGIHKPVFVMGHPSGLPLKVTAGATVRSHKRDFYVANLDSFEGNSGSPVFNENYEVAGILVRGEVDFSHLGSCYVSHHCEEDRCDGEDITMPQLVQDALEKIVSN